MLKWIIKQSQRDIAEISRLDTISYMDGSQLLRLITYVVGLWLL